MHYFLTSVLRYIVQNRLVGTFSQWQDPQLFKELCGFVAFWLVVFAFMSYCFGIWFVVAFWMIPYVTTFPIIDWFCELVEHYPMRDDAENSLEFSRNRLGGAWEKFFFGIHCEHMHGEHHINPAVPFWNLSKARMIRLHDVEYAVWDKTLSGIFVRGEHNNLPIIEQMMLYHDAQT